MIVYCGGVLRHGVISMVVDGGLELVGVGWSWLEGGCGVMWGAI